MSDQNEGVGRERRVDRSNQSVHRLSREERRVILHVHHEDESRTDDQSQEMAEAAVVREVVSELLQKQNAGVTSCLHGYLVEVASRGAVVVFTDAAAAIILDEHIRRDYTYLMAA